MSRENGAGHIIKAFMTAVTFLALTDEFRIIKAALDDLGGRTRWTRDAIWPTQLTDGLITLDIIDQMLDIDLHRWTPVRGRGMGWHQCTRSSHSTTLESNKSDFCYALHTSVRFSERSSCTREPLCRMPAKARSRHAHVESYRSASVSTVDSRMSVL